jgi:hypothetical protein
MNANQRPAKAYLKTGCPYSFKFLLFMSEARLLEHIEIVRCDPDDVNFASIKERLAAGLGKEATFPTVEVEPGRFEADSDRLIEYYAKKHSAVRGSLTALAFYTDTIFPQLVELHE